jgi:hypothetical protein
MSHEIISTNHCNYCGEKLEDCNCKHERLLTTVELAQAAGFYDPADTVFIDGYEMSIAKAQDTKSIAALIEWLDETCDKHQDKEKCDPEYFPLKRNCPTCWQELKESVK